MLSHHDALPTYRLAELCGVSVRQLTRSFRTARGCSVGAFVVDRQIAHAKRMLAADEGVGAIAIALGFSSSSNFCAALRRSVGMTPGQYQQSIGRASCRERGCQYV